MPIDDFRHRNRRPNRIGDKYVVMVAVNQDPQASECASDDLKADKDVVMLAVNQDEYDRGLQYTSDD